MRMYLWNYGKGKEAMRENAVGTAARLEELRQFVQDLNWLMSDLLLHLGLVPEDSRVSQLCPKYEPRFKFHKKED